MFIYPRLLILLQAVALTLVLGFLWLIANSPNHSFSGEETLLNLVLVAVAGFLMLAAWQLGRRDRAGWACFLLFFGFPTTFIGFLFALLLVGVRGHH